MYLSYQRLHGFDKWKRPTIYLAKPLSVNIYLSVAAFFQVTQCTHPNSIYRQNKSDI